MPVSELCTTSSGIRPVPIASKLHLIDLLLILFGTAAAGFLAQHHASSAATVGQLTDHGKAITSTSLHSLWTGHSSTTATPEFAEGAAHSPHYQQAAGPRPKTSSLM